MLAVRVFRGIRSNFVCSSFPFGIEGELWDEIVLIPDHCLFIYFTTVRTVGGHTEVVY